MFGLVKTYKQKAPRQNRPLVEVEAAKKKGSKKAGRGSSFKMKGIWFYPLVALVVMVSLAMVNNYQENLALAGFSVSFLEADNNHFLDEEDILNVIQGEENQLLGAKMGDIALRDLEQTLLGNPFVKEAEIYKSNSGILNIDVALRKPIARLINNSGNYLYLDEEGNKFPDSRKHSVRVPLIRGDFEESVADTFVCETLMRALPVMNYIHNNKFWNAQVSEIAIRTSGELIIYPQVGDLYIEFGQPDKIAQKFDNALVFYQQAIPKVGWKKYRYLSVKNDGQIVAKRKR